MAETSAGRFDNEAYTNAQKSLKGDILETTSPEKQGQIEAAQKLAAAKIAAGVEKSRQIGEKSDKDLAASRQDAPKILAGAFDDFSRPNSTSQVNQSSSPSLQEKGALGTLTNQRLGALDTTSTTPTSKVEKPDTVEILNTGSTQSKIVTKEAQAAQEQLQSGNTSPDNFKKVMDGVKNGFESLPKGLQDFFKGILNFMKGLAGNNDNNSVLGAFIKNPDGKIILDKYAKSDISPDGKMNLAFNPGVTITKSKVEKSPDINPTTPDSTGNKNPDNTPGTTPTNEPKKSVSSKIDGNKLILDKDTKITTVQEYAGTITLVAQNKDGSIDTYTIVNTQEKSASALPEGLPSQSA